MDSILKETVPFSTKILYGISSVRMNQLEPVRKPVRNARYQYQILKQVFSFSEKTGNQNLKLQFLF